MTRRSDPYTTQRGLKCDGHREEGGREDCGEVGAGQLVGGEGEDLKEKLVSFALCVDPVKRSTTYFHALKCCDCGCDQQRCGEENPGHG